ncbi:hypothetical protein TL16_g12316 [Triparma laevis f. inornata]|uniref:Uncharacterized protein n=1 Tax=Triparma laevis f. inornata TaxID=1714386 RepID=A0A9W7BT86_9STRA|nr:hypothetical protein TL16_g12316 [Triparma laevis f. inornata]
MIASILEQQVEVDQVEAVVKETPQKTETENGAGWASPELREMSYNEVRSIAKNTPGVKAKGSKVDLIAAIAAINEVVEVETAPVAVDSPKVFMTGDECGEDECIKELEKLMLADLYEEEEADSEVWDMLKSQEIAKDIRWVKRRGEERSD